MVTFDDVRVFFEKLLKIFPVFAGSFYIIGYIVTAIRLSQYNLPAVKLLDAQYFFAGALVGGVIWLAIFILLSASLYKLEEENEITRSRRKKITKALPYTLLPMLIFLIFSSYLPDNIDLILTSLAILFMIFAFWFSIIEDRDNTDRTNRKITWRMAITILTLIVLGITAAQRVYSIVPQVYGGELPLSVILYVDADKVPGELIESNHNIESETPALTTPLHLVFRTSDEYIVDPIDDNKEHAWIINSSSVYALVELPEERIPEP